MNGADEPCVFCELLQQDAMSERRSAFAIRDKFPIRRLHSLILPKRHVADAFELIPDEIQDVFELARLERDRIMGDDCEVGGFNFGADIGRTAGQKSCMFTFTSSRVGRAKTTCRPQDDAYKASQAKASDALIFQ